MKKTEKSKSSEPTSETKTNSSPSTKLKKVSEDVQGEKLPFSMLTQIYEIVGNTEGKNSKNIQKNYLSGMFKDLAKRSTDDLVRGYWLSIVKCGPEYERN